MTHYQAYPQQAPDPRYQVPAVPSAPPMSPLPYGQPYAASVLDVEVANHVRSGWAVESRSETMAVMVSGSRPNHVLHLLLTLLTCGFWVFIWLLVAATSRMSRVALVVNPDGTVARTKH
ncbi:hypothetical protein [Actinoplanes sp. NPDC051859]|uniref:hypothetical protein n=1 Tax=Actinoplanes sp. NPDC051859 TaxID=3363909 RepID=UPI003793C54C